MTAGRHRVVEQGALTAAAVGAMYAIWLGLGLPALPIPLLGHGGTNGATRGALFVTEFPKGAIRTDAATFAPTARTEATAVPRHVRAARASRTRVAVLGGVASPRVPVTVTAPSPAQSRETTSSAPPPAPKSIQEAVATVTSESAPPTVTQTPLPDVPPIAPVTVPSIPDATLPPPPSTLPSDPLPQTPSPPAGLPELPSTPG